MAKDHGPSVKDDKLYESLRNEGESKEKAARDRQREGRRNGCQPEGRRGRALSGVD